MKSALERTEIGEVRVRVASLSQLDELVGKHITGEVPKVIWEDSHSLFQFESRSEAQEAIRDVYFHRFHPDVDWEHTDVVEVRQYQPYSSSLGLAWQVVEQMSAEQRVLEVRREGRHWIASFGDGRRVAAQTAPLAICLAGLRAHGFEALLDEDECATTER